MISGIFKVLGILAIMLVFSLAITWATATYLTIPVVQFSYPQQECLRVKYGPPEYNCDKLPDRYFVEWVGGRR